MISLIPDIYKIYEKWGTIKHVPHLPYLGTSWGTKVEYITFYSDNIKIDKDSELENQQFYLFLSSKRC